MDIAVHADAATALQLATTISQSQKTPRETKARAQEILDRAALPGTKIPLTVPRLESIVVSVVGRATGRRRPACRTVADYEAVVGPLYALLYGIAQGASAGTLARGGSISRTVWERASDRDGRSLSRLLLGRVTIPAAVAVMNRTGLGPFEPDISGAELRRAGLKAMGTVIDSLGIQAEHVIFGHTHRPGPVADDEVEDGINGRAAVGLEQAVRDTRSSARRRATRSPGEGPENPGSARHAANARRGAQNHTPRSSVATADPSTSVACAARMEADVDAPRARDDRRAGRAAGS